MRTRPIDRHDGRDRQLLRRLLLGGEHRPQQGQTARGERRLQKPAAINTQHLEFCTLHCFPRPHFSVFNRFFSSACRRSMSFGCLEKLSKTSPTTWSTSLANS